MREIKVSGLILPSVLGIKVTRFSWTSDLGYIKANGTSI